MLLPRVSRWAALVGTLMALCSAPRYAQAQDAPDRVSVLTMGPGDHPFTRFGHNALLLEWNDGRDAVYNFGTFDFQGMRGARDFLAGRFRYWLSVGTLSGTLRSYSAARRALSAQELSLSPAERAQLFATLAENALPPNRYYAYDYYRDNCSTRVRDALNTVLRGGLQRQVQGAGRLSYRQHTLRLVASAPALLFGLDVALGRMTDRPVSRWDELFLPQELHDELARARRPGTSEPLVRAERVLLTAHRPPLPLSAPSRTLAYAAWGGSLSVLLAALGAAAARGRAPRLAFGVVTAVLGLLLGLLGTTLLLLACSKHWAAHDNVSLLACPPWGLALAWCGARLARGRGGARAAFALLGLSLLTSLSLLVFALPAPHEPLRPAVLFLPLWAGWLYGAWRAGSKPIPPRPTQARAVACSGGGTVLGDRGDGPTADAGPGEDSRSFSGGSSGATCMTALVRAERIAAFTTSRIVLSSMPFGSIRSAGLVRNVPTETSSKSRTTA